MSNPFEVSISDSTSSSVPPRLRLKRIGVLSVGVFCGAMGAAMGLLFLPFFLLVVFADPNFNSAAGANPAVVGGVVGMFLVPIFYGVMGFIGGIINAFIYNLIAGMTGGISLELSPE